MAGKIKLTPNELNTVSTKMNSFSTQIENLGRQIDNELKNLRMQWEGSASQQFYDQWDSQRDSFRKISELLRTVGTQLKTVASRIESADKL